MKHKLMLLMTALTPRLRLIALRNQWLVITRSIASLLLLTGLLALTGCKKETIQPTEQAESQMAQLLQLPADASPALRSTTDHLRQQLLQQDYSADFIRRHGLPLWGKAIQTGGTDDFMLYVPLQLPGQDKLSGFVAVRRHNGQLGYRLFTKAAVEAGSTGLPRWQPAYWLAQLEADVSGVPVKLGHLWPEALANTKRQSTQGNYFAVLRANSLISHGGCCIGIWYNLDGDFSNGNEYYSHHDCSGCVINSMDGVDGFAGGLGGGTGAGSGGAGSGGGGGSGGGVGSTPPPVVTFLSGTLQLNTEQTLWLMQNLDAANSIAQALEESKAELNPLTDMPYVTYTDLAIDISKATIASAMANYIEGPYDLAHWQVIAPYMQLPNNTVIDPALLWRMFTLYCAIKKIEHPEWSKWRIFWEALKEAKHEILDGIGMIPVIGEIADLTNGILYTIQGDGVNASLSFAAMIPFGGWLATGAKVAKKTMNLGGGQTATLLSHAVNTVITFGQRSDLRTVLQLGPIANNPLIAHHIIPWARREHWAVQKAANARQGFHMNELQNGIPLSNAVHSGNHSAYLARIDARFQRIDPNLSPDLTKVEIEQIIFDIREAIRLNPNTHIDNLIF